jgi:hypothetical protein
MTTLNKLHALLDKIQDAEHLYDTQYAAMEFAQYGRDLLRVVEQLENTVHRIEDHMLGQGSDNLLYSCLPEARMALTGLEEDL